MITKRFNTQKLLCSLLFLISTANTLWAQTEESPDKTLSPYFYIPGGDKQTDELPLLKTTADVTIAGVMADVKVTQLYKNSGTKPIEAVYVFPGSTRAAVYDMNMHIGKRSIHAKIEEIQKARQDYEQARQEGKTASLLEQQRPNVFQMNVANLMPGDTIKVELFYTELLTPENNEYEFVYPAVVGPRYSNQLLASAAPSDKWVANPYTRAGVNPFYLFDVKTSINAGMPLQEVLCTSHEVNVNFDGANTASIQLKESEKSRGNKDYILKYRLAGKKVENGLLLYEGEKENFFLLMMQPPKALNVKEVPAREYIFIVDVSGSMQGFPLETSKELLKNLIGNLNPADKFNVVLFAGASSIWSEQSQAATKDNIDKAIQHINQQRGGGGTELLPALRKALAVNTDEKFARTFIIATDGYVSCEKEAFDLIRTNLNTANFFSFGIGTSVNRYLMEGMAYAGMGEPFVITRPEEAVAAGRKFKNYVELPLLTNIKINYQGLNVYDVEPLSVPDVFAERPVVVFGKYKGTAGGQITINGYNGNGSYSHTLTVQEYKAEKKNSALKYLWARHKIKNLDYYSKLGAGESVKNEITRLGLEYNLLTAYTSFIAIDNQVRNEGGKGATVKQPLPLPEGVSDYAVGNYSLNSVGTIAPGYINSYGGTSNVSLQEVVIQKKSNGLTRHKYKAAAYSTSESDSKADTVKDEEKERILSTAQVMPAFPGGETELNKFIQQHLKYPESARQQKIEGTVQLQFVVDRNGKIKKIKVIKSLSKDLDKEAIRLVKAMPDWKPGEENGKKVEVYYNLPVAFKLN